MTRASRSGQTVASAPRELAGDPGVVDDQRRVRAHEPALGDDGDPLEQPRRHGRALDAGGLGLPDDPLDDGAGFVLGDRDVGRAAACRRGPRRRCPAAKWRATSRAAASMSGTDAGALMPDERA